MPEITLRMGGLITGRRTALCVPHSLPSNLLASCSMNCLCQCPTTARLPMNRVHQGCEGRFRAIVWLAIAVFACFDIKPVLLHDISHLADPRTPRLAIAVTKRSILVEVCFGQVAGANKTPEFKFEELKSEPPAENFLHKRFNQGRSRSGMQTVGL